MYNSTIADKAEKLLEKLSTSAAVDTLDGYKAQAHLLEVIALANQNDVMEKQEKTMHKQAVAMESQAKALEQKADAASRHVTALEALQRTISAKTFS